MLFACTGEPTTAHFELPSAADDFYDLPFPNDLRRAPDSGRLDLSAFPTNAVIVNLFREAAEQLDGFGLNSAMYARFDGGVDLSSLPTAAQSITDEASVYVIDVDHDSPTRGEKTPVVVRFKPVGTQTIGENHLVVRPYPGFPLSEATTYALVITTRVRGSNGEGILVAPQFAHVVRPATNGEDPQLALAHAAYKPLFDYLDEAGGDSRGDVATAAVFTTQNATFIAPALRAGVYAAPAPIAAEVQTMEPLEGQRYRIIIGTYTAPNFQSGDVPYKNSPSGRIDVDNTGRAIVQRMEPMRFMVTVPTMTPMPANGWPICLYQHGTTGDWGSFVGDGTADRLAMQGIAVISTDQVLHGPRNPGSDPSIDFFNFGNPYAARDNVLQGFADAWSQLRLVTDAQLDAGGTVHRFDMTKVFFFGHSQGGNTGPGFVAFEPLLKGAVLSGAAGLLYENLLHKTEPLDIPALVSTFVRDDYLDGTGIDEDTPSLALVQMWIERSDSINYAPLMVRNTPTVDGQKLAPRNIYQTEGFVDTYSPNIGLEALATALGGDIVDLVDKKDIEGLTLLRGRTIRAAPISQNLEGVTVVLGQFKQRPQSDGHFVAFDIPAARLQTSSFLGTLANTGKATVVPVP